MERDLMASITLRWNTVDSIPAGTDPLRYKVFTVDFINDREVEAVTSKTVLLNGSISEDVLGIRRKLKFALRPSEVVANVDFLTAFLRSPFKWVLTNDAGYFFALGTLSAIITVPVVLDESKFSIDVSSFLEGIELITRDIYTIPTPPTGSATEVTNPVVTILTGQLLRFRVYRSDTSGGALTYRGESTGATYTDAGGNHKYYKITTIGIAGESLYSGEFYAGAL
jgi:hypothetical protein